MYLLFTILLVIGSFCAGLFGRKLGSFGAWYIIVSCLLFAFFISTTWIFRLTKKWFL